MKKNFFSGNIRGLIVLAAAIGLIVTGILLGQYSQVLGKAIRVCLECIGIG
ncbi:MAG: thioredoxin [Lachnospiraceae bacterium]|nr:thioredoxin [Lachnospiraceae bacterium]MCR5769293.1 thioredoxin [Lachnospiraceae bacterium]